ncbi:autotransporter-associated beta strand repeat-containing protein (plasmid) [Ensifer sp. PDNC004]|uniref:autotransporter-associated beta strand repeat-containing protein n=1 Tax=Ensifer sp. PDNC004 TaxID=2811423 RepID=UPI001965520F|nr:autotransporter-associated beta strand repeat-containing protein [Ensifer sp. PDNC004]QRY64870.1 autotransporter-associated beta strand repeat-containing protein [Ensifer sp. PDNC004]
MFNRTAWLSNVSLLALVTTGMPATAADVTLDGGMTTVNGAGGGTYPSPWVIKGDLTIGATVSTQFKVENGGSVTSGYATLGLGPDQTQSGNFGVGMTVTGAGSTFTSALLTVAKSGRATVNIEDGAVVDSSWQAVIADDYRSYGFVNVDGQGSEWRVGNVLTLGNYGTGQLRIGQGGLVRAQAVQLGWGFDGMRYGGGSVALQGTAGNRGVLETMFVFPGPGNASLLFDGGILRATYSGINFMQGSMEPSIGAGGAFIDSNGYDVTIGNAFRGSGDLHKIGAGTLTLTGANYFRGKAMVEAGTLQLDGSYGDFDPVTTPAQVFVHAAATFGGAGTLDGTATIADGASLTGQSGRRLTVNGDLLLSPGSTINVALAGASAGPLFSVGGDLRLDGTLNISASPFGPGQYGPGIYRLFTYGGSLIDGGVTIGALPAGSTPDQFSVQTGIAGQVNMIRTTMGLGYQFWDGPNLALYQNGQVNGGSGTWTANGAGWSDQNDLLTGAYDNPSFAVFQGTAGTVTVDNSAGATGVTGLQFAVNGYGLTGDPVNLRGSGETVVRVGNGTFMGQLMTATVGSALTGSSGLTKTDMGTLLLTGTNSYAGGTRIEGGTVRVDGAGTLGAATGALAIAAGARLDLYGTTQRVGGLSGAGTVSDTKSGSTLLGILLSDQAADTTFSGRLQNGGKGLYLRKEGTGRLTMTGANTLYTLSADGGEVVLSGAGASLAASYSIDAGSRGPGTIRIDQGATASSDFLQIANNTGGTATVTVAGSGSSLTSRIAVVGLLAEGNVRVEDGGQLTTTGNAFFGANSGFIGRTTVTGAGALWKSTGNIILGLSGEGQLVIENGGEVDASLLTLGYGSDGFGQATVRGTAASRGILTAGVITTDSGTSKLLFDGGILRPQGDQTDLIRGLAPGEVEIGAGGLYYEDRGYDVTISQRLSGMGTLVKRGSGTLNLTANNTQTGGTIIEEGTLQLSGLSGGLNTMGGALTIASGATLALGGSNPVSVGSLSGGGTIINLAAGTRRYVAVTQSGNTTFSGRIVNGPGEADLMVFGTGTLTMTGNSNYRLTVADQGNIAMAGGADIVNDTVYARFGSMITVGGLNTQLETSRLELGDAGSGTLRVENYGRVISDTPVRLSGSLSPSGLGIVELNGTGGARGSLVAPGLVRGIGQASLRFDGGTLVASAHEADFLKGFAAGDISIGAGGAFIATNGYSIGILTPFTGGGEIIKQGNGTLTLSGLNDASAAYTGATTVSAGTLAIAGTFGDPVGRAARVTAGFSGTLKGTGRIAGSVLVDHGGMLRQEEGQTLAVDGDLAFASSGIFSVGLGEPGNAALVAVGGDVTLDGRLDIVDKGGFGTGIYRLMTYGGVLIDRGMNIGTLPAGAQPGALSVQTGAAGTVNLVNAAGLTLGFWDGAQPSGRSNGRIEGGSGTWSMDMASAGPNWTDQNGAINGGYNPNPTYAVFSGTGGMVNVDNPGSEIDITGMQFAADGYGLAGDGLVLQGASGETVIRVGDGTAAGAAMTATLGVALSGTSKLIKDDLGTLALSGVNTYSGGTDIRGGTLRIAADTALGASSGNLIFSGGALQIAGNLNSLRSVSMLGPTGGIFDVAGSATASFRGVISGGGLTKRGAGTLALGGINTYAGGTRVEAGTLRLLDAGALGSGAIRMAGGTTLGFASSPYSNLGTIALDGNVTFAVDAGQDAGLYRTISGNAGFDKTGAGTLSLYGDNSFTGNVRVRQGRLWLDNWSRTANRSIADTARLTLDAGARIDFQQSETFGELTGAGLANITYAGPNGITVGTTGSDFTFAGNLSGMAPLASGYGLQKVGAGTFTLTGASDTDHTIRVGGGRLRVDGSIDSRRIEIAGGALAGTGRIAGIVTVENGGRLEGRAGQTLTLGGLSLSSGSVLDVALGTPSATALFDVSGNVTLDGRLDISDAGGFSAGVYRILSYGGSLTDNGLEIGAIPSSGERDSLAVQTAVSGQLNLVSTKGAALAFWDGGNAALHGNQRIDGGDGTWSLGSRNWTDAAGIRNGGYGPSPPLAIFGGTGGTVRVDNAGGAVGVSGMQFLADGYRLTGGPLTLAGTGGETVIRVGDGTTAGATMTANISASLQGDTDLVKEDRGTLVLSGANSFGGDTLVRAGTLIGTAASVRGDIGNAGTVVFDQTADGRFAGGIGSLGGVSGTMVKRGAGSLTLTGTSSLDWTVEAGTLRTATAHFTGDVAIGAGGRFTLDQAEVGSFAGNLTGTGRFSATGGGRVTLTGDTTGFAGLTDVTGATLVVDRELGGSALIGKGGRLSGSGTLGSGAGSVLTIDDGGTIAPGYSPGMLTVDGDLVMERGGRYEVEAAPGIGAADIIRVTGSAMLLGGTAAHIGATGGYDPAAAYRILTADGGITGRFDRVTSDFAFLDVALLYEPKDIRLTLKRNGTAFEDVGISRNQRATARALDSLSPGNRLHDRIAQLDGRTARIAFDQLSGEIHASTATSLLEDSRHVRDAINDRLRAAFGETTVRSDPVITYGPDGSFTSTAADDQGPVFWSIGFGSWSDTDSDGNAAALERSTRGILFGADALFLDEWRVGLLGGYSHSGFEAKDRFSQASTESYHAGVYAGTVLSGVSLRTGLAFTWHDMETRRGIDLIGLAEALAADYGATNLQAFGEVAYAMDIANIRLEPFANLAHVRLDTGSWRETSGIGPLSGERGVQGVTFSTLGLRAEREIGLGQATGTLHGTIGWRHAMGDTMPHSTLGFAGSDLFTVGGTPVAKDSLLLEAGLGFDFTPAATLELSYTGQLSDSARDHGVKAELNLRF